jgi:hypothetical protein
LWRPLRTKVRLATVIILVLGKLHNCIIDNGESASPPNPSTTDSSGHTSLSQMTVVLQDEAVTDEFMHKRRRDLEACELRTVFTQEIESTRLKRPNGC